MDDDDDYGVTMMCWHPCFDCALVCDDGYGVTMMCWHPCGQNSMIPIPACGRYQTTSTWIIQHHRQSSSLSLLWSSSSSLIIITANRVEICRDRHNRRSCKICASCVNFPQKQCDFLHNMHKTTKFAHTKCDFALKL